MKISYNLKRCFIKTLTKKALQSQCTYLVSAVALNKKKEVLGYTFNRQKIVRKMGGDHSEQRLIRMYKRSVKYIIIYRCNKHGKRLPILPCPKCRKIASRCGVRITEL